MTRAFEHKQIIWQKIQSNMLLRGQSNKTLRKDRHLLYLLFSFSFLNCSASEGCGGCFSTGIAMSGSTTLVM